MKQLISIIFLLSSILRIIGQSAIKPEGQSSQYTLKEQHLTLIATDSLLTGLLSINHNIFDYIYKYSKNGYSFIGANMSCNNIDGHVSFYTDVDNIDPYEAYPVNRDSINYLVTHNTYNSIVLDAFSIWFDKINVGGFVVGDPICIMMDKLGLHNKDICLSKITIINPRISKSIDGMKHTSTNPLWNYIPERIIVSISNDTIIHIYSDNLHNSLFLTPNNI